MQKERIANIVTRSTIALIIPVLGQLFVDGWNWGLGEFVFAWVFFTILGITYAVVTDRVSHPRLRIVAGVAVVLAFAFVWGVLATG